LKSLNCIRLYDNVIEIYLQQHACNIRMDRKNSQWFDYRYYLYYLYR